MRGAGSEILKHPSVEKLHGDEGVFVLLTDVVDAADVGMIEGRGSTRFPAETLECLGIAGKLFRQELERNDASEAVVLGLVHHTHTPTAEPLSRTRQ